MSTSTITERVKKSGPFFFDRIRSIGQAVALTLLTFTGASMLTSCSGESGPEDALLAEDAGSTASKPTLESDMSSQVGEASDALSDPCAEAIYEFGGPFRTTDDLGDVILDTIEYINETGGVEVALGEGGVSHIFTPGIEPYFVAVIDDGIIIPRLQDDEGFTYHFMLWTVIYTFENQKEFVPQYTEANDNIGAPNGFLLDVQRFSQPGVFLTNVILNEDGRIKAVCYQDRFGWTYEYGLTEERQKQFASFDPSEWQSVGSPEVRVE